MKKSEDWGKVGMGQRWAGGGRSENEENVWVCERATNKICCVTDT